jgi:hypothetical protein
MKRIIWIGLISLGLGLVAAQCGAIPSANEANNTSGAQTAGQAAAPEEVQEAAPEAGVEPTTEPTGEAAVADDPAPAESEAEAAAASPADQAAATCDDPFAGVSIGFNAGVWTANTLARFAGPTVVDPNSGLSTNFCLHSVDYSEIFSGGPPPDGIRPLDNPAFEAQSAGDQWLSDQQPVLALAVGAEAKAYPLAILTRHEIVNDEIGGIPVAATFCPLCNTGLVFKREVNGQVLRFGVSGNLRNSDMVMWDNKTLSWWQQFTGEAIVGELTGSQLELVPAQLVAWKDFKAAFPEGVVLSTEGRDYGRNPYAGYDSLPRPFLFADTPDPRLPALARIVGYEAADVAKAYPLTTLAAVGIIEDTVGEQALVVFYQPGQVSALDKSVIADSKEVGSGALFIPAANGQPLTFSYDAGVITDNETGSTWNIFGQAISGELAGAQLETLLTRTDFWFAWAAFNPETELYEN